MMIKLTVFSVLALIVSTSALEWVVNPVNQVLVEGDTMEMSCAAADSSAYPNVLYKRLSKDGFSYGEVKPSNRIHIQNSTRNDTDNGRLITTSVLRATHVLPSDDLSKGAWNCFAIDQSGTEKNTGMSIHVITKNQLPKGVIRGAGTLSIGDSVNLTCDITDGSAYQAPLKRVSWKKDMLILKNGTSATNLDPVIITNATMQDGGIYSCAAIVSLKQVTDRPLILDTATINIQLKMDKWNTTAVRGNENSSVIMDCPADGFPLNVTWMRVNEEGKKVQLVTNERYVVSRPCASCRYRLTIKTLQLTDLGRYACVASSNMETGIHYFKLSFGKEEKPTTGSSAVTSNVQSFLVLLLGVVTWMLH